MILTQHDGTKREISSDELTKLIREGASRITPDTPIERFGAQFIHDTAKAPEADPEPWPDVENGWHFAVDADGRMTMFPLVERRRQWPSLRSVVLSVSVATLAGFMAVWWL